MVEVSLVLDLDIVNINKQEMFALRFKFCYIFV